jgi:hypothetical protein
MSNDKEIVIPISKIKTTPDLSLVERDESAVKFEINEMNPEHDDPKENIKVLKEGQIAIKFPKFIQLIATHDFEQIMDDHKSEDVIISSDLLVDLAATAQTYEEPDGSRLSWVFLGLVLGLVVGSIVFLLLLN